jgi:hypothetical protein
VLQPRGSGIVISVDEAQVGGSRLVQDISSLLSSARNARWPLNFLVAGLRAMRKLIAPNSRNAGSLGQLERASWLAVAPRLTAAETEFAIVKALQLTGRAWKLSPDATRRVVELTAGYPYAVQLLGSELWDAVPRPQRIELDDVERVRAAYAAKLGTTVFTSRWRQMPTEERRYAHAMAELLAAAPVVTNAQIAERLGKRPNETTYLRERLLDAGVIVLGSTPRSAEFITPLLAEYVLAHGDEIDGS